MRNQAPVKDRTGNQDKTGNRSRPSRAQLLALLVGLFQIAFALLPVLPLAEGHHALHICTGLAGVVLAWRHEHARLYGVALLLVYGKLLFDDMNASTTWLQLPTLDTVAYGRSAVAGLVIVLVPAFGRR
ncbi:hypothetical protein [Saccharothrix australiensis]|uniref:Uncharacterized protein n=1 Tax=Saccharothrix australiensis TaxID=2072 RepID=A0A495VXK4_9PSEU|nr:hypothetical protein [Saccharothrix australiensis]RKT54056.1 hypothetical protein C8E97_2645 [Saccharothrix australiensis]